MTDVDIQIQNCIRCAKSFLLDAGAGAGKTHSLVEALKFIVGSESGQKLARNSQQVACITFTNVAKEEIIERTGKNPTLHISTIHDFLWTVIKPHQKAVKRALIRHNAKLSADSRRKRDPEALERALEKANVSYSDRGAEFLEGRIFHDDLLAIARLLFADNPLMARIAAAQFPIIFVDEYQDTSAAVLEILIDWILKTNDGKVVIGFFGDKLQSIYHTGENAGIGEIPVNQRERLIVIPKVENYRCSKTVITVLNRIRTDIKQFPAGKNVDGSVAFIRLQAPTNEQDIVETARHVLKDRLGWNLEGREQKELYLTHRLIARKAGYEELLKLYTDRGGFARDDLISGEDRTISFLKEKIEPLVAAWKAGRTGKVLSILTENGFKLERVNAKREAREALTQLNRLYDDGSLGDLLKHITRYKLIALPDEISEELAIRQNSNASLSEPADDDAKAHRKFYDELFALPYKQVTALCAFLDEHSPFSTKHGVKGAEFDTVFVVLDDKGAAWRIYSFDKYLNGEDEKKNPDRFVRTRNLFYVCCSRAKSNLVVIDLAAGSKAKDARIQEMFGVSNCVF